MVTFVSLMVVLAAAGSACSLGTGTLRSDAPPSTLTQVDNPILAPPPTSVLPATTVPALPQPMIIPQDPYYDEPIREIGTMEIPALGMSSTIYDGVTLHNIDLGPSHWPGTAEPGHAGNTVFAGHRVSHSRPFRDIDRLVEGDEVIFTVGGARSVYEVTEHLVVGPQDSWIADQTFEPTGTLYACHPPGSLEYRYVVRLKLAA